MTDKEVKTNTKTCNVPDCGKPAYNGRGLCVTHYWRMKKGKAPADRAYLEKYANPSTRKPPTPKPASSISRISQKAEKLRKMRERKPQAKPAFDADDEIEETETRPAKRVNLSPDEMIQRIAEERIAAVSEFATALGLSHLDYDGGLLFANVAGDVKAKLEGGAIQPLYISQYGKLRYATLTMSDRPE